MPAYILDYMIPPSHITHTGKVDSYQTSLSIMAEIARLCQALRLLTSLMYNHLFSQCFLIDIPDESHHIQSNGLYVGVG